VKGLLLKLSQAMSREDFLLCVVDVPEDLLEKVV
jgi:hypothetical protein